MTKVTKPISFALIFIILVSIIAPHASASTIVPYSIPTISSTKCSRCSQQMEFVLEDCEEVIKTVAASSCPNTVDYGISPHDHYYYYYYSVYMCNSCGTWGRMRTRTEMLCEITRPDGKSTKSRFYP